MPNILSLLVEQPDEVRNAGAYGSSAVLRVQSATASTGPFTDVTGTGSTPTVAILAATRSYTGYDPAGDTTTWYRTRYEDGTASRVSSWSDPFQVTAEGSGLLCGYWDVEQALGQTLSANDRESVIEHCGQVTTTIESYCGRWFVPRPATGTMTLTLSPGYDVRSKLLDGSELLLPLGVRSLSSFGYATDDQPSSGGSYTSITATDVILLPGESGWPSTALRLRSTVGAVLVDEVLNGLQLVGAFGFAAVPADVVGVATRAVVRRYLGKASGRPVIATGPSGNEYILPDMSGADRAVLDYYRMVWI